MIQIATLAVYAIVVAVVGLVAAAVRRRIDLLSSILFIALPVLFFFSGFLSNRTPIPLDHLARFPPWAAQAASPYNPSLSDVATQFVPWAKAVRMAWKEGSLPLRNPWNGCGTPLAFGGTSAAFFPLTFLVLALPLAQAFVVLGAAKLLIAQTGAFLWLSELGLSRPAARFGAISFGLSFALTPWLLHPGAASMCLLPWVLFLAELLGDSSVRRRAFVLMVGTLVIWSLGGHLETVALGILFCGFWFAGRLVSGDLGNWRPILLWGTFAALLALGLSAFALLPQFLVVRSSNRLVLAQSPERFEHVPWVPYRPIWLGALVTPVVPTAFGDLVGSPMIPGAAGSIVEMGFGYFGTLGLALCLVVVRRQAYRPRRELTLLAIVFVGLGGATGVPPFRWLFESIPGLGLAPPLRLLLLVSAAGAPLAAFAVDRVLTEPGNRWKALIGAQTAVAVFVAGVYLVLRPQYAVLRAVDFHRRVLLLTLALLAIAAAVTFLAGRGTLSRTQLAATLTTLAIAELMIQGSRLYRLYDPKDLYPETPLVRFLRAQPRPFRIVGAEAAFFPSTNIFAGVESIETQDPTERADYIDFLDRTTGYSRFEYFRTVRDLNSPALDFLNVRFLVTAKGAPPPPGAKWSLAYDGDDGRVFQNTDVLPRFFVPHRIRRAGTPGNTSFNESKAASEMLNRFLAAPTFREEALVLLGLSVGTVSENHANVAVTEIRETTNSVRIRTSVPPQAGSAVLVASIVNDGGWSARDERGNTVFVGLANGPFLALIVPRGTREVSLKYSPPGFRLGAAISTITLVGGAVFFIIIRRRTVMGTR